MPMSKKGTSRRQERDGTEQADRIKQAKDVPPDLPARRYERRGEYQR